MEIFKKVKINIKDGKLRQIRIFNIPIFQYERKELGKNKYSLPFIKREKPMNTKSVFYLKVNNPNYIYSLRCLQSWLNLVSAIGGDFYIVCDKYDIEQKILQVIEFPTSDIKFIKSDKKTFKEQIKYICGKYWYNAGNAHLTTFSHAQKLGLNEFWNIDADDTIFYETPENMALALNKVMDYAKENDIDVFSYDMHASRFNNKHWSFGVTYTRNCSKIFDIIKNTKTKDWQKEYVDVQEIFGDYNLDWYFTYLKYKNIINAQTFNIDNLYFAHWGFGTPTALTRLVQVETDRKLYFPLANELCKDEFMLTIPLNKDIIVFDAQIDKGKSLQCLSNMLSSYETKIKNATRKDET